QDFPHQLNIRIAPQGIHVYEQRRTFNKLGLHNYGPSVNDQAGAWYEIPNNGTTTVSHGSINLVPAPTACADLAPRDAFCTQMYSNPDLAGGPLFVEVESPASPWPAANAWPINAQWGDGGPGHGVPVDGFSIRWSGRFNFAAGTWRF